jgi:hypothetical protein
MRRLLPHSTRPSPRDRRVGIHDFTFVESGFRGQQVLLKCVATVLPVCFGPAAGLL